MVYFYLLLAVVLTVLWVLWTTNATFKRNFAKIYYAFSCLFKKTPKENLQSALDQRSKALVAARSALEKSGVIVRQCERDERQTRQDINTLNVQIKVAIKKENEGKARKLIGRLQKEEENQKIKKDQLNEALETHQFYKHTVAIEEEVIKEAKKESSRQSIRLELAKADEVYRTSADVSGMVSDLRTKANIAEIGVKTSHPTEDEFDKAANEQAINDRLAVFKKEEE